MEKELKKTLLVAVGISTMVVVLTLAVPFNMIVLFMLVIPSGSISSIWTVTVVVLGALILMLFFDLLRSMLLRRFALYLSENLGQKILLAMFKDRASQLNSDSGSAMNDLGQVRSFLQSPIAPALLDALISPFQLAIIFYISPIMGLLALAGMLVILSFKLFGLSAIRTRLRRSGEQFSRSNAFAQECVYNAQTARAMGMQSHLAARWRKIQDQVVADQAGASEKAGVHSAATRSTVWIMQVLLMGAGTYLIITGTLGGGAMLVAVIIAGRVVSPMQTVVTGWEQYQNARDAFDRLKEFWSRLQAQEQEPRVDLPRPEGRLTAESLVYGPDRIPIIKGISFDLEPGEILGVIGPSGAGKTTLARVITGVVKPTSGTLRLDGADMHHWDQDRLGTFIGYLPQEVELFPGTIGENIARFQDASDEEVREAARLAGIDELIEELPKSYDTPLEERGKNLAGGFRQRIGLARALFGDPRLIIFDEPDAALDRAGLEALQAAVERARSAGITLVLATHLQQLLRVTDKLLMLKGGQVALYGPTAEVLQKLLPRSPAVPQRGSTPSPPAQG